MEERKKKKKKKERRERKKKKEEKDYVRSIRQGWLAELSSRHRKCREW